MALFLIHTVLSLIWQNHQKATKNKFNCHIILKILSDLLIITDLADGKRLKRLKDYASQIRALTRRRINVFLTRRRINLQICKIGNYRHSS